jgi:hypothetical protein
MVKLYPNFNHFRTTLFVFLTSTIGLTSVAFSRTDLAGISSPSRIFPDGNISMPAHPLQESGRSESRIPYHGSSDRQGCSQDIRPFDVTSTLTIWNGSSWDSGFPGPGVSATINGNYNGPGFSCLDLKVAAAINFAPTSEVTALGSVEVLTQNVLGSIKLEGTQAQLLKGNFFDLVLNNDSGASFTAASTLKGSLRLLNGQLKTNNFLTLLSNASATARVGRIEEGASIIGNVTLRRFVPGTTASWYFLGVPVAGQTRSDWTDNFTLLDNFIFLHNEAGSLNIDDQINGWEYAPQSLVPGKGYRTFLNQSFFNGTPLIDNTGSLITGPFSFPISFTPEGYDGGGWNFLANPYACEVDWHAFTRSDVGGQIHIWNKSQYASYSQGAGLGVNGGSRYIPSYQGFFVKSSSQAASLLVNENAKPLTPVNPTFLRTSTTEGDVARITMRAPNGDKDETAIRWMPEASGFFESEYDVDKLRNTGLTFFSNTGEGRPVAIQGRNYVDSDSVLLGYQSATFGSHFLEIRIGADVFEGKVWRLRDNMTGFIHPIATPELLHAFDIPEGLEIMNYRFSLLVENTPVAVSTQLRKPEIQLFPNPGSTEIQVVFPGGNGQYRLLDAKGQTWKAGKLETATNRIPVSELPGGIYFIEIQNEAGKWTKKWVKNP